MNETLTPAEEEACRQLEARGYTVLEGLLDEEEAARLDTRARELMDDKSGYVKLEGALNSIPALAPLCMHPAVLRLAGHFSGMMALSVMVISSGQTLVQHLVMLQYPTPCAFFRSSVRSSMSRGCISSAAGKVSGFWSKARIPLQRVVVRHFSFPLVSSLQSGAYALYVCPLQ